LPSSSFLEKKDEKNFSGPDKARLFFEMSFDYPTKRKVYKAVYDYFLLVKNDDYDNYMHELMVSDIKNIRKDVIMIPAFDDSFSSTSKSMYQISLKEQTFWQELLMPFNDNRHCHLSVENNKIFAELVDTWINGEPVDIDVDKFVDPVREKFYYMDLP